MKSLFQTVAQCVLLACCASAADTAVVPSYRVGDTARVDIIAPFPLVAIDPDKTAELKQKEAAKVPPVVRWNTNEAARVMAEFRARVAEEQVRFIEALIADYKKASINATAVDSGRFRNLFKSLQDTNRPSPLTLALAKVWATNGDDRALLGPVEERLSEVAALNIRPDRWPTNWGSAWQFRLVAIDASNSITFEAAEKTKLSLRRTNLFSLGRVRGDFQKAFPRELKPYAKFAMDLLQPNTFAEEGLTRDLRQARVQDVWSAKNYAAGEPIVRAGEIMTPLAKAACDELRVRMLAMKAQEPAPRPTWIAPAIMSAIAFVVICGSIVVWSLRRRRAAMLALQVTAPTTINADPAMRAQLVERMTRLLGENLVKRLFVDRNRLLESQGDAAAQTQQLEERIETIQARVQQKYREYEDRITQLERELATAEEEKRDLIRAKIVLARQELEAERAKHRVDWN